MKQKDNNSNWFEKFATKATKATGSSSAFVIACGIILVWSFSGPIFKYSDVWQLVINTATTIVTFLMVFLIQKSQNKDAVAIHIKLNELLAANEKASNRMVSIEGLTEEELVRINEVYARLARIAKKDKSHKTSISIDDPRISNK